MADRFKDRSLQVPPPVAEKNTCVRCGEPLEGRANRVKYPCLRRCGEFGCSVKCAQGRYETGECTGVTFTMAKFGERFSGPNFPLTKAVALAGGAVQKPLDILISENRWGFFAETGRQTLTEQEEPKTSKSA